MSDVFNCDICNEVISLDHYNHVEDNHGNEYEACDECVNAKGEADMDYLTQNERVYE